MILNPKNKTGKSDVECVKDVFGKMGYLLLVVRQHLIGSQVLTRCPPLFVVHGIQAVVESRSSREIDNIPQI